MIHEIVRRMLFENGVPGVPGVPEQKTEGLEPRRKTSDLEHLTNRSSVPGVPCEKNDSFEGGIGTLGTPDQKEGVPRVSTEKSGTGDNGEERNTRNTGNTTKTSDSECTETGLTPPIPLGEMIIEDRGVPLAWTNDPTFVRVYAWALVNLRFGPFLTPLNIQKLATDCRIDVVEARQALEQLVRDGDLIIQSERRGKGTYWLAPIRWSLDKSMEMGKAEALLPREGK